VELALTAVAVAEDIQITDEEVAAEQQRLADEYKLTVEQVKAAVADEDLKRDLRLQKASKLVLDEAKVGEAPKKEEGEEKPKKTTRKKKTDEAEGEEKPKRTRKKKTDEAEEPKAE
jgi:trigger factor